MIAGSSSGIAPERIRELGHEDNWWGPPGPHGPCGPDSEIFHGDVELGNNVFVVYEQTASGELRPLPQHNVDVGMGLERITCLRQGVDSVDDTDLFTDVRRSVRALTRTSDERAERIVCDHVRSGVLLIADGVLPSNREHGYVLRRLLRRAIRQGRTLGIDGPFLRTVGESVSDDPRVLDVLEQEERRFARTLKRGLREISRLDHVDGRVLFHLFETYGLPPELTLEELGTDLEWRGEFSPRPKSTAGAAGPQIARGADPASARQRAGACSVSCGAATF